MIELQVAWLYYDDGLEIDFHPLQWKLTHWRSIIK